ncbi:MAG: zinc ABC transporter substrate-binding protein [Gammaproteobacteria bacterium]|jgi:zinc/manganese transport system substrate-binding protein|nr:zinc ABC transporter substrate-binding protein [Gammaproteobacteria bacterium]MDH3847979.1 zinc ABC transporter substrate-binding protein [Gammaproteobacteria bacterium]MDH3864078.1 zinc ABC transporter substrate-binding protein [Gammaproteobacteria bacterium]MDH3904588.1 zinc ABC transporter substrate-binding protein [Gammaproteobacteria bacterium]MDH3953482.1 zinc ABC transporter substrate-binding protein [Gammaproteobacteria bacterium]
MKRLIAVLLAVWLPMSANALNVFSCEPEWAALVQEVAGDNVTITQATTAFQDPHMLQARPSLIAGARSADLLICTGADLEIGWLPLLLRRSGNPGIQPGSPGYFMAADYVRRIEIPASVDRSQGDVHPQGNPHIHLHPRNIERVAEALADRLAQLDSANAEAYRANADDFLRRWNEARDRWEEQAASLAGLRLVSHHRSFSYLADWLDLDIVATLEPKPGIPASGAHLSRLLEQLTPAPPAGIIRAPFENEKPAHWLSDRLSIPVIEMAFTVGGSDEATDLFGLYEQTIATLEEYRE